MSCAASVCGGVPCARIRQDRAKARFSCDVTSKRVRVTIVAVGVGDRSEGGKITRFFHSCDVNFKLRFFR